MAKRLTSILLSLALLLTCVSGLTLAVGADDLDYSKVVQVDFSSGEAVTKNIASGIKQRNSNYSITPELVADTGKYGVRLDTHGEGGFYYRPDNVGISNEPVAVTVEYYLTNKTDPANAVSENARLVIRSEGDISGRKNKIFRKKGYSNNNVDSGYIANPDYNLSTNAWDIATFIVSGEEAVNLFAGDVAVFMWEGDTVFWVGSVSIFPASMLAGEETMDYVYDLDRLENPVYPSYGCVYAKGITAQKGDGGTNETDLWYVKFNTPIAAQRYAIIKVFFNQVASGNYTVSYQKAAGTVWGHNSNNPSKGDYFVAGIEDAYFNNQINFGCSFRITNSEHIFKRVEVYLYEDKSEYDSALSAMNAVIERNGVQVAQCIGGAEFKSNTELGSSDPQNGRLMVKDGSYCWMVTKGGKWVGITDPNGVLDSANVTFEYDIYFDCAMNGNSRVFLQYGDRFNNNESGDKFNGFAAHGNWVPVNCPIAQTDLPKNGTGWGTISLTTTEYAAQVSSGCISKLAIYSENGCAIYVKGIRAYVTGDPTKKIEIAFQSCSNTANTAPLESALKQSVTKQYYFENDAWAAYQAVLTRGWDVLGSGIATQADLNQALADLRAAKDELAFDVTDGTVLEAKHANFVGKQGWVNDSNNISNTARGSYIDFSVNVKQTDLYDIAFSFATENSNASFQLQDGSGNVLGSSSIAKTANWNTYQDNTITGVLLKSGVQTLRIYFNGNPGNLASITFAQGDEVAAIPDTYILKNVSGFNNWNGGPGPIVAYDGYYAYKIPQDNGALAPSGYNRVLASSTSVTYEIVCQFTKSGEHFGIFYGQNGAQPSTWFDANEDTTGKWGTYKLVVDGYTDSKAYGDTALVMFGSQYLYIRSFRVYDNDDPSKVVEFSGRKVYDKDALLAARGEVLPAYCYTNDSYTGYAAAIATADTLLAQDTVTEQEVYEAIVRLEIAQDALVPTTYIYGNSLTLEGQIGVNFYVHLADEVIADAGAYFTVNDGDPILVSGLTPVVEDGKTLYKVTGLVAAKEMKDDVVLKLYDGSDNLITMKERTLGEITSYTYTVETYLENNTVSDLDDLVAAMADYGAYAQAYFNYGTPGTPGDVSDVTAATVSAHAPAVHSGTEIAAGIIYKGSSLILESETTLRFYFQVSGDASGYGFDGQAHGYYYREITNIAAKDLDEKYAVTVAGATVEESALTYAYKVLSNDGNSDELKNLARALVKYNAAANAYFTQTP